MKLKYPFVTQKVNADYMSVAVGQGQDNFYGMVKMNRTAYTIFEMLNDDLTEEELLAKLRAKYQNIDEANVLAIVGKLRDRGLVE